MENPERRRGRPPRNIIGERFGRLIVIGLAEPGGKSRKRICKCDCGRTTLVTITNLVKHNTRSCGCGQLDGLRRHAANPDMVTEAPS